MFSYMISRHSMMRFRIFCNGTGNRSQFVIPWTQHINRVVEHVNRVTSMLCCGSSLAHSAMMRTVSIHIWWIGSNNLVMVPTNCTVFVVWLRWWSNNLFVVKAAWRISFFLTVAIKLTNLSMLVSVILTCTYIRTISTAGFVDIQRLL